MTFSFNDFIGSTGVLILLLAYLLNLTNKISKDGFTYSFLNVLGAALACIASWLIHYIPFVALEIVWVLVSLVAMISALRKKS